MPLEVRVQVSNRHVHLSQSDLELLFGAGHALRVKKPLNGPEFAAEETVTLVGPKGKIEGVRILGPLRKESQVELLRSDCFRLGVDAPIRISGDTAGSATLTILGPAGALELKEGAIIALRHVHIGSETAKAHGLADGQMVSVRIGGIRGLVFDNAMIRILPNSSAGATMHIDTEEGNAANVENNSMAEMV